MHGYHRKAQIQVGAELEKVPSTDFRRIYALARRKCIASSQIVGPPVAGGDTSSHRVLAENVGERDSTPPPSSARTRESIIKRTPLRTFEGRRLSPRICVTEQVGVCPGWGRCQFGGAARGGVGEGRGRRPVRRNDAGVSDRRGEVI